MYSNEYFEAYALLVLIHFSKQFDNRYYKSESPDWISKDTGIEVTRAHNPVKTKIESYCCKLLGKRKEFSNQSIFENAKADLFFNDNVLVGYSTDIYESGNSQLDICTSEIKKKTKKLNVNYAVRNKNFLFVFVELEIDRFFCDKLMKKVKEIWKDTIYKYQEVYVFDMGAVYRLNFASSSITKRNVDQGRLKYFKSMALKYNKNYQALKGQVFNAKVLEEML